MDILRRDGDKPLVIAHRGASAHAPENTMPAFQSAWASGASWVETDVQVSADGVPMLLHDDDLMRTTGVAGAVRELTGRTLAALDAGSWFGPRFAGATVPELSDLLATLDGSRSLLLELKGPHTRDEVLAEMEVVRASGWDERVFYHSFETETLRHVRSIEPGRVVSLAVEQIVADPVAACADVGAAAYCPDHRLLRSRPDVVGELHAAGVAVLAWTADQPDDWAFLTRLQVDGICTNKPAELLAWLR